MFLVAIAVVAIAGFTVYRLHHAADANKGAATVDVGAPQLAMHSSRELMGAADVPAYAAALQAFLSP